MKRKIKKRLFCMVLAGLVLLAGCTPKEKKSVYPTALEQSDQEEINKKQKGEENQQEECLRIYLGEFSEELSPFFYVTDGDERLLDLMYTKVSEENGDGAAQITVTKNVSGGRHTIYQITIKENVMDKDGHLFTADDLLFNYYLRCQLDYQGIDQINQMSIVGLEEYQYGVSGKKLRLRKKKVQEKMSYPTKGVAKKIRQEIILPALKKEYAWIESLYLSQSQKKLTDKYPQPEMLFARYFAPDTSYTGKGKRKKQVLLDVAEQYGGDVKKLSKVTGEDYTFAVRCLLIRQLWPEQNTGTGKIAGIRKKDDRTIEIETTGFQTKDKERLENLYLLSRNGLLDTQSGFNLPPGSGPYYPEQKTEDGLLLTSNDYYQEGSPYIGRIQIVEREVVGKGENVSVECANGITEGRLDMAVVWERAEKEKEDLKKVLGEGKTAWKVAANGGVLYSTERINATTIPNRMTATEDVIKKIGQLKKNE